MTTFDDRENAFEAKFAQVEPDCPGCPPITGAYRPVVLRLKAVQTAPGVYGGSLYVSQAGGSDIWVGGADVIFGADSSSSGQARLSTKLKFHKFCGKNTKLKFSF